MTEYQDRVIIPPSAYLVQCQIPFTSPPKTYGEAVLRDPVWLEAWRLCANQIQHLRRFYGYGEDLIP